MAAWEKATRPNGDPETCPKCGGQTEDRFSEGEDYRGRPQQIREAERCPACGWVVEFTDNGPVRVR